VPNAISQSTIRDNHRTRDDPPGRRTEGHIEVVQIGTGYRFDTVSNEEGNFTIQYLRDGTFELTAKAEGFQAYRVENIILTGRDIRRIDVQLQIGQVGSVVEVSAGASLVETETARIADTKDREVLRALPLTLRRAWDYFTMTPQIERTGGFQIRFAGTATTKVKRPSTARRSPARAARPSARCWTVPNSSRNAHRNRPGFRRTADDGSSCADQPRRHQRVPRHHRRLLHHARVRARNPFNNTKDGTRQHQMIFSAGGPVIIPKIFNGRNRTFFFHTTEIAFGSLRTSNVNRTVPLQSWRAGNFGNIVDQRSAHGTAVPEQHHPGIAHQSCYEGSAGQVFLSAELRRSERVREQQLPC
jgi:hypothetical protein